MRTRVVIALALTAALVTTSAGHLGDHLGTRTSARALLREAKASLDSTRAVHFQLSSKNLTGSGTNLSAGKGDAVRPDGLRGSFTVSVGGLSAAMDVAAKGGVFEVKLPFATHYSKTNPAALGLGNPAQLLNRATGLSAILTNGTGTHLSGQKRIGGELLDTVTTEVPGSAVPILPIASPTRPVTLVAAIDPHDHQLRQLSLIGYFDSTRSTATYVLRLTKYGEPVSITLPPAT
ncbi:MAG: LppX_LprAFG lipoprotein [Acidimicrobiales bacterium]|nr:LppX_LprAFG lipoprotein [Acidimicrobiales bacterium]